MRLSSATAPDAARLLPLLLLATSPLSTAFKCDGITANDQPYDLSKLAGAHSLVISRPQAASFHNTTYTLDICRPLKRKDDVPKEQQCPDGSRGCAITRVVAKEDPGHGTVDEVFPLAGALKDNGGSSLEPEISKLEDSNPDNSGLRLVMKGGFHQKEGQDKPRPQQTIIDFVCDKDREGTEGEYDAPDKYDDGNGPISEDAFLGVRADDGNDEEQPHEIQLGEGKNASLVFQKYGPSDADSAVDILQLKWRTKYACQGQSDGGSGGSDSKGASWGFFTWLVIIVFFGTASYLIFGSWLNYNRYGARGWDLLPHGDTIRDIPYLLKDWTRRVLNTVQGSGSRGGYSAV